MYHHYSHVIIVRTYTEPPLPLSSLPSPSTPLHPIAVVHSLFHLVVLTLSPALSCSLPFTSFHLHIPPSLPPSLLVPQGDLHELRQQFLQFMKYCETVLRDENAAGAVKETVSARASTYIRTHTTLLRAVVLSEHGHMYVCTRFATAGC